MPTNLYGKGDNYHKYNSHVLPALIRRFHEAKSCGAKSVTCWGTGSPMREFLHVDDLGHAAVFTLENWRPNLESHSECCDMIFNSLGDYYDVRVKTDACIIRGGVVKSTVQFNGNHYKSRDQGWKDEKLVWGSDVIYVLNKTYET